MTYWDGIFAAYMTGSDGQGFAMFVFDNGRFVGADPLGVRFFGSYTLDADDTLVGNVSVTVPPNGTVVQGVTTGSASFTYEVPIRLSREMAEGSVFEISTPLGAVNTRLERLTSLEHLK